MTETIFIIENIDQDNLNNLIKKYPNYKIYCLSYSAHKKLSKINVHHDIGEFLLSEYDKSLIDQQTLQTVSNWYNNDEIRELLIFDGINLASLIELELLHYILSLYRNALSISRIIEYEKPKRVVTASYLNSLIRKICDTNSIELIEIAEYEQPMLYSDKINIKFNIGNLPISFHISRMNFNKIKKISDILIRSSKYNPDSKSKRKSILLVDFNPIIYDDLLNELSKLDKDILLLNQRRPAVWNLKSYKIVKNSKCKIVELGVFQKHIANNNSKLDSLNKNLAVLWKHNKIFSDLFQIDSLPLWDSIKDYFIKMCTLRFNESARRILLLNEFFEKTTISSILEWAETGQEEKELLYQAQKRNIQKLMLQHNLFPYSTMWKNYERFVIGFSYPFLSDKQIVWDELTKSQAISAGLQEEQLLLIGSPKHDKFFNNLNSINNGVILLATTAPTNISIEMSPFDSYVKFENLIREVCRVCKQLPNKQLIIKPHPQADYYTNITKLVKEIDKNIQIIYDANLVDLINSCELLITFNNSTIALESIILNKPTISLQFEKWAEEDKIVTMNALLSITETDQIENGIKNLLYDENIKNTYQENRRIFLDKFVNKGVSAKKLTKFLDNL